MNVIFASVKVFTKYNLLFISIFMGAFLWASQIKNGFKALEIFNYFEAKRLFEKSEKKHAVPAAYGLSIIYERSDNPFHQLDSAYSKITKAYTGFSHLTPKQKAKYAKWGVVDSLKIIRQRDLISSDLFKRALETNSEFAFNQFIVQNPWSPNVNEATFYRDSLRFFEAKNRATSQAFQSFLSDYPQSEYALRAQNWYDKLLYAEQTQNNQLIDYINFVNHYPNNPFVTNAEDRIFELATVTKTAESYRLFIRDYPKNHNVNVAWKRYYESEMQKDFSVQAIKVFVESNPEYPFLLQAQEEMKWQNATLLPLNWRGKWGYLSKDGQKEIEFIYDFARPFNEGLAAVSMNGKTGFIDKTGQMRIEAKFDDADDFHEGFAVVEMNELFGLINRSGEYIVEPIYEDLGGVYEGLCAFETDEGYGYFDQKGFVRLRPSFSDAYDFENGVAVVAKNDYYGLIDAFGTTFLPFMFDDVSRLDSNNYKVEMDGEYGVMNLNKDTILPIKFDYIEAVGEQCYLVELDDEINYYSLKDSAFISENWFETYPEYKIWGKFHHGWAKVKLEDGFQFISPNGQLFFSKTYSNLGQFDTYIAFQKDDKWGYMIQSGQILIKPQFDKAFSFDGVHQTGGIVELSPLYGLIKPDGNEIYHPYYEEFILFSDSVYIVKSRGKYGLLNTMGDTLIPFKYRYIEPFDAEVVKLTGENDILYYFVSQNRWIRKED